MRVIVTPYGGDDNPYLKLLATALEDAGLDVHLASLSFLPLWGAVLRHGWPDVIHLQWQHRYFVVRKEPWTWIGWAVLRTLSFFLQLLTLRLLGIRFVWTVHNIVNHRGLHAKWELSACRLLARLVNGIIIHCDRVRPTVAAAYDVAPDRLHVVPHGHYADWYPPSRNKREARRMLALSDNAPVFLFYGLVKEYKGLDRLLKAFAALRDQTARLVLLGKPSPQSLGHHLAKEAAADDRVTVCFEFIPNDRLVAYIGACDLVVLPYERSLTSGAGILAASYSRPILAPDEGCVGEFPAEAAILYDPAKPDALPRALEQALSAPLPLMGTAAKRYVEQFSWSLVATETSKLYQLVLDRNQSPNERQNPL
jgi:glycosyltransferase involved in cell wall biosynthesis